MDKITKNTLVSILLEIRDQSGKLLEENEEIMYLHGGYGQIFQKLEDALEGKSLGDSFDMFLTPTEAFGIYDETLVEQEALENLPEDITLGMDFEVENENEKTIWVVEDIKEGYATLNANHELAGIPLRISGEILELEQLNDEGANEILTMEHAH